MAEHPARSDITSRCSGAGPALPRHSRRQGYTTGRLPEFLDERALFMGQWGLKPAGVGRAPYEELVETEGRPRLRMWLERAQTEGLLEAAVVYGYFPCVSDGDDLIVLGETVPSGPVHLPASAPRPAAVPVRLLPPEDSGEADVVGFQVATVGAGSVRRRESCSPRTPTASTSSCTACRAADRGAGRVLARADPARARHRRRRSRGPGRLLQGRLPGRRYSFGYPACPDLADRAK